MKAIKTLGLALVCVAAGCGSSSSGRGGTGATSVAGVSSAQPTAGSLVGTWVGSWQSGSDQGQALLLVYPNATFSGWVASTQDPGERACSSAW